MGRRLVHAVKAHHRLKEGQRVAFHHPARDGRVVHDDHEAPRAARQARREDRVSDSRFCVAALSSGGFAVLHFLVKFRAYQEDPSDNAARLCAAINGLVVLATIGLAIDMWRRAYRNKHPKPHKADQPTKKQWKPRACCVDDTTDDTIIDVQIDDSDDLDGLMRALDEPQPKKKKIKPRPPTEPPLPDPEPSSPSVEDALMRALETPVPVDQPAPPPKKKKIKPRPPLEPPPPPEANRSSRRRRPPSRRRCAGRPPPPLRTAHRTWTLCNASWPTLPSPGFFAASERRRRRRRERGGVEPAAGGRGRSPVDGKGPRGERARGGATRACGTLAGDAQRSARGPDRATARAERGRPVRATLADLECPAALPPRVMARTRTWPIVTGEETHHQYTPPEPRPRPLRRQRGGKGTP